jgi:preprotein translocase subunit SecG
MILTLANVVYVLVAVAMIALILLQRGAGAAAGSGFGGGASATVFGARGASNFLSKSTAVLAGLFFVISLGMAMVATRATAPVAADDDLGVMSSALDAAPVDPEMPVAPSEVPAAATSSEVPAAVAPDSVPPPDESTETEAAQTQSDKLD